MSEQQCTHVRDDGSRCRVDFGLNPETGRCFHHDPHRAEERLAAKRKGARVLNRSKRGERIRTVGEEEAPDPPTNVEEAVEFASWALHGVVTGRLDAETARVAGYLVRAYTDGRKHLDKVDARVKELAAKLKKLRDVG